MSRRAAVLLLSLIASVALAACGGSTTAPTTTATTTAPLILLQQPKPGCDKGGPSSLAPAVCQAAGRPSLDPSFSAGFKAPNVDAESASCAEQPNVVFYAADDWIRLAQKLAADAYPCANYFISIPPVQDGQGTYTTPTPGQVPRLRKLGERFHAMAEIRVAAWQEWLAANPGKTWFDAGVEARRRMGAAGYDPAKGDLWAVNEFPLAILTDTSMRRDMQDLVRGLHDGGALGPTQGLVFMVEPGQAETDLGQYKSEKERFFEDAPFWREMSRSVRFWGAEVYASTQNCCVPGSGQETRATKVDEYLLHPLSLAEAAPPRVAAATEFMRRAYAPVGNAAWQWSESYGFTDVAAGQMERFLADQTFAIRRFEESRHQPLAGFGFAWAPVNEAGASPSAFAAQTGDILDGLASSIDDSFRLRSADGACGPEGAGCRCQVDGSAFNDAWASFARWQ